MSVSFWINNILSLVCMMILDHWSVHTLPQVICRSLDFLFIYLFNKQPISRATATGYGSHISVTISFLSEALWTDFSLNLFFIYFKINSNSNLAHFTFYKAIAIFFLSKANKSFVFLSSSNKWDSDFRLWDLSFVCVLQSAIWRYIMNVWETF